MFRTIRKKRNEISNDAAEELLIHARRGILALNGDDNYPYAIPVNYYFDPTKWKIYFHGSRVGYKVDAMNKCDKVCFTVFGNETVKEEVWAPYVQSVVVFGRCHAIQDPTEKEFRLKQFAMKYYPGENLVLAEISASGKAAQMYEIEIEHLSGKEVQER